jgi:hypothetical protein
MLLLKKDKSLYIIALTLFLLAAFYGLLMRWNFTFPIANFPYKNVLQSHSHVAFLGWGYIAVITAISQLYLTQIQQKNSLFKFSFYTAVIAISLMLISFPLGGYKVFSIVLLSVFGIASYGISIKLLQFLKGNAWSIKLIKYGIYYYLLSSLATWFLAYVLVTQGKTTLYYNTVYFYLHFLYNGFFVFVLFGLLFKVIENQNIVIDNKLQKYFFVFLNIACIPAYALSVLWSNVSILYNVIGFIASVLQLISLLFLIKMVKQLWLQLQWKTISKLLLKFVMWAYALKIVMQVFSAFPYFVSKSLALKPFFIIGYLHLFTLAFMSVFIFLLLNKFGKIELKTNTSKLGIYLFLGGIASTELLMFTQGFLIAYALGSIDNYAIYMLLSSMLIVLGLIMIYIKQFTFETKKVLF